MFFLSRDKIFKAISVISVGLLLLTAGCGAITNDSGNSGDNDSKGDNFQLADYIRERIDNGKKLRIKLDYHDPSLAFATPIREGMNRAGKKLGADVQLIGPTGGDPAKQVAQLQTLIQQKSVDGIAVSSVSSNALKPVIAQAYDAGIPIISFNTNNPGSKQMGFVGQDLKASGEVEAKQLRQALGDTTDGTVVVFSLDTGAGWSHDRFSGFKSAMSDSDLDVVGPINVGNEPNAAYNTVASTMAGQDDVVAIAGLDCCSTTAAAKWVEQSGNAGKITTVGFDVLPQTAEFIKSGIVTFTISQNPKEQGFQAVKVLYTYLMSRAMSVDTGAKIVDKKNLSDVAVEK